MRYRRNRLATVVVGGLLVTAAAGITFAQPRTAAPAPKGATSAASSVERPWSVGGGDIAIRWNHDLAGDLGLRIAPGSVHGQRATDGSERFSLQDSRRLQFLVTNGYAREMAGGALQARGGYAIQFKGGSIDLDGFRLVPRRVKPGMEPEFDLVDAQGVAWFHVDHVMHELLDDPPSLTIGSSDIRISERLAQRLGAPHAAGMAIAELQLDAPVLARGSGDLQPQANYITWHGQAAPNGGTYQNDIFMLSTFTQFSRCQGCTGNAGSGTMVITPSATLKNNVNEGSINATVPGDPLGTSTALWTATIPWYQKFTAPSPPYNNDQHPYLIWNMYRTNPDGSLEQIGRSGVKHAYLTTNGSCLDSGDHHGHALGRGCTDTYSVGNNDYTQGMTSRDEILPSSGLWGRCGSVFDTNCDGVMNNSPGDSYSYRMLVNEAQVSPTANPGAGWLFESWYVARSDINIYNSMSTRVTTPGWTGSTWNIASSSERLGSAIDRWFDVAPPLPNPRNPHMNPNKERRLITELVDGGARAKLAVKARRLVGGGWEYHYALMNFEFAFAMTEGASPNLRITSTQGFDAFALATASGASITSTTFRDGDLQSGNDWDFVAGADSVEWSAGSAGRTLGWGELYSFTVRSSKAPVAGTATLRADGSGRGTAFEVATLVPGS
ncbi:hypothetical protein [Luteimonas sp. MC1750]|uniref:hypothetical protein n=1 Tax=Luteimonas sp. MC1750 TaxID=2799326 RepID=UPI0018F08789|nr:hypothetical protein [Luteimonas sp. MC1750]MBJ6983398.1 hypothetical protein [Luteimonas sp. MC1750]QQO06251.1 hypothetical protein JGR68_02050 [Luteimonas sp. MC1750]